MKTPFYVVMMAWVLSIACSKKNNSEGDAYASKAYNGTDLSTLPTVSGNGAMMQSFYWDVTPQGGWWNTLVSKIDDWASVGIDKIWLPPLSKGAAGFNSMGYDPFDYFDFGEYNQMGSIETRFGSRTELEALITKVHSKNVQAIADIVMGHNSGGDLEYNPQRQKSTYTKFTPLSKKFARSWEDYHPNPTHFSDGNALFFAEQDLCHQVDNVKNWFWRYQDISLSQYYSKTMKIDGWRFDYVKSFSPSVIKDFMATVPNTWAVGEYWDGDVNMVKTWSDQAEVNAFDFPNFYTMKLAFNSNDLSYLNLQPAYFKINPNKAVVFVSNHDTEKDVQDNKIANKDFAYAYLLMLPAYPCIFYNDYEGGLKKTIQRLMLIRKTIAVGEFKVLYYGIDEFVCAREGSDKNPGLILYMNISGVAKQRNITTHWANSSIVDYMSEKSGTQQALTTDATGKVTLTVPANAYSIWSLSEIKF